MLKMSDINIIWQSGKIPNGPWAVRTALPVDVKKSFEAFLLDLPKSHRKVYDDVEKGAGIGYVPATMELMVSPGANSTVVTFRTVVPIRYTCPST